MHLDEVYVKINGEMHYLWRAVDQEGEVLGSYVTRTRDKAAALTFMKKALKGTVKANAPLFPNEVGGERTRARFCKFTANEPTLLASSMP